MLHPFVAFLAVSAIVIVTPGPDTALTIRNTLLGGRANGLATALGVASGQAVWTVAASAGVTALLLASRPAFLAIQLAGAVYLVLLGVQSLVHAWRGRRARDLAPAGRAAAPGSPDGSRPRGLREGALSNLGNPKMAVFFTSMLPQFLPPGEPSFMVPLGLGLVFCSMTLAWLSLYAVLVSRVGDVLNRSAVRRALDALMGAALVALGLRLAAERS